MATLPPGNPHPKWERVGILPPPSMLSTPAARMQRMAEARSSRQKVDRDARVVADRARGLTWPTIARRHALSERQCRSIWKAELAREPLRQADALEALKEALTQLEATIEDLALLAESSANDAVRLGAIKARALAQGQKLELMQLTGLLPRDHRPALTRLDLDRLTDEIVAIFERWKVPGAAEDELVAALGPIRFGSNGDGQLSSAA